MHEAASYQEPTVGPCDEDISSNNYFSNEFFKSPPTITAKVSSFSNRGSSSVTCTTQPPRERRDDRYGGPTPRGEYLIGKRYTNPQYNIDWYNLYPKKEDNSGYYGYTQRTRTGRYAMGLHPGRVSLGCVTVKAPTYNRDACWQRIRRVIDSGNMYYRGSSYSGFLYVR